MKTEKLIDKLFELLGEMHDDLLEHKCENVESYNQQITKLFEQKPVAVSHYLLLRPAKIHDDSCPKCDAGSDERELINRDFLGIEAIHMHCLCKKCGSEIIEEFTLTDVFIDNSTT